MEKKRELGPLMPGMVFNTTKLGIIDLPEIGYDRMWEMDEPDENGKIQFWLDDIREDLQPIPLTPVILRDWFGMIHHTWREEPTFESMGLTVNLKETMFGYEVKFGLSTFHHIRYVNQLQLIFASRGIDHKVNIKLWKRKGNI